MQIHNKTFASISRSAFLKTDIRAGRTQTNDFEKESLLKLYELNLPKLLSNPPTEAETIKEGADT